MKTLYKSTQNWRSIANAVLLLATLACVASVSVGSGAKNYRVKKEGGGGGEGRKLPSPPPPPLSYFGSRPSFARAKYRSLVLLCSPTPRKCLVCCCRAKPSFLKCFSSTRKRKAGVFKFLEFEEFYREKLRFRDGLVWTVGLTAEIKLRF